jgi:type VI secretion system protein ImpA
MPRDVITLPDVSDEAPCGENLEFDADFGAMERAAQGKPETQYGDTINPAVPPEWKEVEALATSLLERTRDLRIMTHLAVARLNLRGLPPFADVLTQIRQVLETRWEQVHPQLDPEDDLDPVLRANALLRLCDPLQVMRTLRTMPLAAAPRVGSVSWRDIAVAHGTLEPEPGVAKPSEAAMQAVFAETNQDRLTELREAVDIAVDEVTGIRNAFDAAAGAGTGPDFTDLSKLLREIQKELRVFGTVAALEAAESAEEAADADADGEDAAEGSPILRSAPASRGTFNIRSISNVGKRDDALYLLEVAAAYFRTHEPSSPVPLLIDRACRLGSMEFLDILRDLAPDGLNQAENIVGRPAE